MTGAPPHDVLRTLGDRVRARRLEMELSQERLAERAQLHRNYVGGIEQGKRNVALLNLVKLSVALEVDLGELVAGLQRRDY
jgi:transcriptional regulator with XRE-family HTH domain